MTATTFRFTAYQLDPETGTIHLHYALDEHEFTETIELPVTKSVEQTPQLDAALKALHMAGGVSYYKASLPKTIEVASQEVNQDQAQFWRTVYEKGLGEFFYQNQIDFRGLINFPVTTEDNKMPDAQAHDDRVLVPIGGGKDSVVTIQRLRAAGKEATLLRVGSHPLIDDMVEAMNLPCITIKRSLDPLLFKFNEEGALNGHVPITAYLSCLCTVVAEVFGFSTIAFSNEKSANVGNVEYLGQEINHQWSKSAEFETMFQDYVHTYINPELTYYSELRALTELEIVQEFVQFPQYFDCFTSCNRNWKIISSSPKPPPLLEEGEKGGGGRWCGECPKCAFVFALLAAYLPKEQVTNIFTKDLYADESLVPLYKQLLNLEGFKPFECVGTPEETAEAMQLAKTRQEWSDSPILDLV